MAYDPQTLWNHPHRRDPADMSDRSFEKAVRRATKSGKGWSCWQADRYAILCGLHPAVVWPDWLIDPHPDGCICPGCRDVPRRKPVQYRPVAPLQAS